MFEEGRGLCILWLMFLVEKVAILGAGLLGASIAKALKARGGARRVSVWSRSESTRAKCAKLEGIFDEVCASPQEAVADADIVVICTPTDQIAKLAKEISANLKSGAILTDVGSVKTDICRLSSEALKGSGASFIGSHPMAGSEKIGVDFSDENLFDNRVCFVVLPDGARDCAAQKIIEEFWRSMGMRVKIVSANLHDAIVARVSHLPHLLAGLLCVTSENFSEENLLECAGPGFRDCTRVASGSPAVWDSIVADNREQIVKALKNYSANLDTLIENIESADSEKIAKFLRRAKAYRDQL